jgi:hypothetical protein
MCCRQKTTTMKDEKTKTRQLKPWGESDVDGQANRRTTLHLSLHRKREVGLYNHINFATNIIEEFYHV